MEKHELEDLKTKVPCSALLEREGWAIDIKESTRRAIKFRRAEGEIIIVIHDGRGWFDPLSTKKGDVFDLAGHLGASGFVEAYDHVASAVGFLPSAPAWKRPSRAMPKVPIGERWRFRLAPTFGSATWRYLASDRDLPGDLLQSAIVQDCLREGPQGSMWAAHRNPEGMLTGWEERGPAWRGFAKGGAKTLFRLGASGPSRVCVTEAAIDAMSLAAIEVQRSDTLYVSTGGGWSPTTDDALRQLARDGRVRLVAATDNNRQGEIYAERIRALAIDCGADYARCRPRADDWNDDLRALAKRLAREPWPAAG